MTREFTVLHHRQALTGGHWDLTENPIPYRAATATAPQGDGTLCAALSQLAAEGWLPVMSLHQPQGQTGETFLLLARNGGCGPTGAEA